jgi:trimeric autotransporter adhesin
MCFQRPLIGGRELPGLLRPFGRFVRVAIFVHCVGLLPAWAAPAATTTTALSVSSAGNAVATVTSGTVVTLTATVTAGNNAVTPGQINFCDAAANYCTDIHLLGTAQLTSNGTATLYLRPGVGSHSYRAIFVGTNTNAPSSSAASSLTVTGISPTMTSIASSGAPGGYSLTATVLGNGHASPTGTVSFLDTSNLNQVLATSTLTPGTAGLNLIPSMLPEFAPTSLAVGDFNGDGVPDLAVSEFGIDIVLGNGDGTFKAGVLAPGNLLPYIVFIAVGDFNGDGRLDLAVAYCNDSCPTSQPGAVEILLGNGDGTFNLAAASPATGNTPTAIATGDFNGDGNLDLAITNGGSNTVTILLGNGDGTFTAAASPATGNSPSSLVVGDFNGDGKADLAVTNETDNTVTILLGNGDGTFQAAASPATGNRPFAIAAGDFTGKGKVDLAVANASGNTITILLGNGEGTFTAATGPAIAGPSPIAVADFNGDGMADLAVGGNAPALFLGNGDGTFTPSAPLAPFIYPIQSVVAADLDGDGIADVVDSTEGPDSDGGSVTVFLTETQSATATANGIAVSPVNGNAAIHAIVASYPGDIAYGGSVSTPAQLAPGAANFSVSGTPLSIAAGASANATITITPNGTFTGTVALQCSVSAGPSGGTGAPGCSISPQASITGVLAVTAMLTVTTQAGTTAGSYTITVTGTSGGSTVTTNVLVTVTGPPVTPTFALSGTTASIGSPGATGNSTISVTPSGGFTGTVALSCAVIGPAGAVDPPTCTVPAQATITGTAAVTAMLTVNTQAATTAGSYMISVTGASGGTTETTNIPLTVSAPPVAPSFTLTNTAVIIALPGATGTSTITVTPSGGFAGSVSLSCAVMGPAGAVDPPTCSVTQPAAITGTRAATARLTVNTTAASASSAQTGNTATGSVGGGVILSVLLFFGVPIRKRGWKTLFMLLMFAAVTGMAAGCGAGANAVKANANPGTAPGNYTVTVTGVAGTTMATTAVTITVN